MSYAIPTVNGYLQLRGQPFELEGIQYPGNIIDLWSEDDLAEIGVLKITPAVPPPVGEIIVAVDLQLVDGILTEIPTYATKLVPDKVHKFWLIKVLEGLGQMDDIEDAMDAAWASGNRSLKRDWLAATEVERNNQLVNEFASSRGFTPEQVDSMFIQALEYQNANQK